VWDVRASRSLGYGFIGVGSGAAADKLHAEGAVHVLPDFQDSARFFVLVSTIQSPEKALQRTASGRCAPAGDR
jgi:hypothetical protein